jgi:predicted ATPase
MVLEAYSVSHGKASAYLPVVELLQAYFRIVSDDDPRTRREKITGRVLALDRALEDTLPYLFALFGLIDEKDAVPGMDADIRKRRTLEAIKRIVLAESLHQPLIVIFEDLHWIDDQTQEFLNLLADSIGTAKILLLMNYRPEYSHTWSNRTHYEQIRLDPLGRESAEEMLDTLLAAPTSSVPLAYSVSGEGKGAVAEGAELGALKRLIIEKTGGTPFFMEEIVQALFEQQVLVRNGGVHLNGSVTQLKIPSTVQAMLASRIDRLPAGQKDLLQTLAVIGREFSSSLVHAVVGQREQRLDSMLDDLQLREFIYEQPAVGETEYIFKHALTQEVAYKSVLVERRKLLHERTAEALVTLFSERMEDHLGEIAHHYRLSSNIEKAVYYLDCAGRHAVGRSLFNEAITHFTGALELLRNQAEGSERLERELRIRIALGPALAAAMGQVHTEVDSCYSRAHELCKQIGDNESLFPVLRGLWLVNVVRARHRTAARHAQELHTLARGDPSGRPLVEAHYAMGLATWNFGELLEAQSHFEQSINLYNFSQHRAQDSMYGYNTLAACLVDLALVLWMRGYAGQALKRVDEALALGRALSQAGSLAMVFNWKAYLHVFRREHLAARACAASANAILSEYTFPNWMTTAGFLHGWALAQQDDLKAGITQMQRALAAARDIQQISFRPFHLCLLAEAYLNVGNVAEARVLLAEAFAIVQDTGELFYLAELHRIQGQLALESDLPRAEPERRAEAENCFRKAIDVAHSQDAKSFELRTTISFARLLAQQGPREEARMMLGNIYNWFTEGFDTPDLKDAKALLDELTAQSLIRGKYALFQMRQR